MISEARMRGDGIYLSISADTSIYAELRRLHNISATTTGLKVKFADARRYKKGRKLFQVWNSGSNSFALCTDDATTLTTLTAGQWATCSLIDNTTQAGVWMLHVGTAGSAPQAPPTQLMYYCGGPSGASNGKGMHEYSQTVDSWATKSSCLQDRTEASASAFGGVGYYMGTGDSGGPGKRSVEHYDPDTWTTGTDMPGTASENSDHDCATTMTGKAYVFGGDDVENRTVEYDGSTWVTKGSRPAGREWEFISSGGFPGHDIGNATTYLLSGGNSTDEGHNYVDSYVVDTYTAKTERPLPVFSEEGRCKNDAAGEIFVVGGIAGFSGGGASWSNRVTKYVTGLDTHIVSAIFPSHIGELMGASYEAKAYIGFGQDDVDIADQGYVKVMREFDLVVETYTTKTSAPQHKEASTQNQSLAIQP